MLDKGKGCIVQENSIINNNDNKERERQAGGLGIYILFCDRYVWRMCNLRN